MSFVENVIIFLFISIRRFQVIHDMHKYEVPATIIGMIIFLGQFFCIITNYKFWNVLSTCDLPQLRQRLVLPHLILKFSRKKILALMVFDLHHEKVFPTESCTDCTHLSESLQYFIMLGHTNLAIAYSVTFHNRFDL